MPLPLPTLDKRTWADLVAEARALLPRYAPEWTDYNAHDPGITLVELFAWLSEMLMFRADQVPPAEVRAFLRWFGVTPLPAQAAATVLALRLPHGGPGISLGGGLKVMDPTSALVFEAGDPVFVSPAWIELSAAEGTSRGQIWSEAAGGFTNLSSANCRPGYAMAPLGAQPGPGDALWLGFDCAPGGPGEVLSLQVWTLTWATDPQVRRALLEETEDRQPCPGAGPSWATRGECLEAGAETAPDTEPGPSPWVHYRARVTWEGWDGAAWRPFHVVTDRTRALSLSGPVQLRLPAVLQPDPPGAPSPGRWWLRCRLVSGGYDCPPQLAGIAVNAAPAANAARVVGPEVIGVSQGSAGETYYLRGTIAEQGLGAGAWPVLAESLQLRLIQGADPPDTRWTEVPNWDRTGPFDRHYVLDPADNSVRLGNGRVGRVAPADWALEAMEYRVGGGPSGNLPSGRLTQVLAGGTAGLAVLQPFAAAGGAVAESLDQAHGRLLARLAAPSRGITVADWETLTLQAPALPVARCKAIPGYLPSLGCWTAPGVVTVVVLPGCGDPPVPSDALLAALQGYLEPRRPVTTELHVVAPNYVGVAVTAVLHTSPQGSTPAPSGPAQPSRGSDRAAAAANLAALAQQVLDRFFDPLHGGPDGTGWPFGRGILESDLMNLLAALPGVAYVDGMSITAAGVCSGCDSVALCPTDLVASGTHQITVVEVPS